VPRAVTCCAQGLSDLRLSGGEAGARMPVFSGGSCLCCIYWGVRSSGKGEFKPYCGAGGGSVALKCPLCSFCRPRPGGVVLQMWLPGTFLVMPPQALISTGVYHSPRLCAGVSGPAMAALCADCALRALFRLCPILGAHCAERGAPPGASWWPFPLPYSSESTRPPPQWHRGRPSKPQCGQT